MDIDIEKEAYIRASSHLLSEKLPNDYQDMTETQLRDYCSDKGIISSYSPTETVKKRLKNFLLIFKKHNKENNFLKNYESG